MSNIIAETSNRGAQLTYLPPLMTEPKTSNFTEVNLHSIHWLGKEYVKITFDHAAVEAEIAEIRELLRDSPDSRAWQ